METHQAVVQGTLSAIEQLYPQVARCLFPTRPAPPDERSDIDLARRRIGDLSVSLYRLRLTLSAMLEDGIPGGETFNLHHVHRLEKLIQPLASSLISTDALRMEIDGEPRWPLSGEETKNLTRHLGEALSHLAMACDAKSPSEILRALSKPDMQPDPGHTYTEVHLPDRVPSDQRARKLPIVRGLPDPDAVARWADSRLNTYLRLRTPGPLDRMVQDPAIQSWIEGQTPNLAISGGPGSGKSVLASAIVEQLIAQAERDPTIAVCYQFFDEHGRYVIGYKELLAGFLGQLGQQHPDASTKLRELMTRKYISFQSASPPFDMVTLPQEVQWSALFIREALTSLGSYYRRIVIVVDGLDAISAAVIAVLDDINQCTFQSSTNMLVLSREATALPYEGNIDITPKPDRIKAYVAGLLQQRAQADPCFTLCAGEEGRIVETIGSSTRRFDVAQLQLDHVLSRGTEVMRRETLRCLPCDLVTLGDEYTQRSSDHRERVIVGYTMLLLQVLQPGELSLQQICECVSLLLARDAKSLAEVPIISEPDLLRLCGLMVRKTGDGSTIELSHKDLPVDVAERDSHRVNGLGVTSIRLLLLQDFSQPPDEFRVELAKKANRRLSLYPYAAEAWMEILNCETGVERHKHTLVGAAHQLFKSISSGNFISWLTEIGRRRLSVLYSLPPPQTFLCLIAVCTRYNISASHIAACFGLGDVLLRLVDEDADGLNEESDLGAPLYCALAGPALLLADVLPLDWAVARKDYRLKPRLDTAKRLAGLGALFKRPVDVPAPRFNAPSFACVALMACAARSGPDDHKLFGSLCCRPGKVTLGKDFLELFRDPTFPYGIADPDSGDGPSRAEYRTFLTGLCAILLEASLKNRIRNLRLAVWEKCARYELILAPSSRLPVDDVEFKRLVFEAMDSAVGPKGTWTEAHLSLTHDERFDPDLPLEGVTDEDRGHTILHQVVEGSALGAVRILLERGADVTIADESGRTPLHLCESSEILRLLVSHGANLHQVDNDGRLLWHYAAANNDIELLRTLVDLDPDKEWVFRQATKQGRTPLAEAFAYVGELHGMPSVPRSQYPKFLDEQMQSIWFILAQLTQINDRDKRYLSSDIPVICLAAEWGEPDIVRLLGTLFQEADLIHGCGRSRRSPLHYMNFYASVDLIRSIRAISGSFDTVDGVQDPKRHGMTPADSIFINFGPGVEEPSYDDAHPSNNADLDREAYMELLSESVCWAFEWGLFCMIIQDHVHLNTAPNIVDDGLVTAVECLIEKGVIREWEEQNEQCAFYYLAHTLFKEVWVEQQNQDAPACLATIYILLIRDTTRIQDVIEDEEFDYFVFPTLPGYERVAAELEARGVAMSQSPWLNADAFRRVGAGPE